MQNERTQDALSGGFASAIILAVEEMAGVEVPA